MKLDKLAAIVLIVSSLSFVVAAQEEERAAEAEKQPVRFEAVDVYVDSGKLPLAAYQFELSDERGSIKIVGVEGGEHPAFKEPPYYDPAALMKGRIIIAAFNTGKELPAGNTRVARVHVRVAGEEAPEYIIKLQVAATLETKKISAKATVRKGEGE